MGGKRRERSEKDVARAQEFRREMNVSEKTLWAVIRDEQVAFKFRRQHAIAGFWLDFYCAEAALCIEVDGELHALRLDRDAHRDDVLAKKGIITVRIPSLDLFEKNSPTMTQWVKRIVAVCEERSGRKAWEKRPR